MAIRNVVQVGDETLRKKSFPVEKFDEALGLLLDDMKETLRKEEGAGLAAPQVGVLRRCVVVDTGEGLVELVNPVIISKAGEQVDLEGCLSCPGEYGKVKRPERVCVKAQDRYGNWFEAEGEELTARAFCHEIEHLDGHLYTEKVDRFLTEEELEELAEED